jgi:hypothetical protein
MPNILVKFTYGASLKKIIPRILVWHETGVVLLKKQKPSYNYAHASQKK